MFLFCISILKIGSNKDLVSSDGNRILFCLFKWLSLITITWHLKMLTLKKKQTLKLNTMSLDQGKSADTHCISCLAVSKSNVLSIVMNIRQ